ncbi:acyltransferase family protein [Kribbella sp. NPDC004536]|uniref:acyltransferase family protein n=1 Tax=Kribbella sp. NPDC004536 TaxID=3364106 RepID=UPI0036906E86
MGKSRDRQLVAYRARHARVAPPTTPPADGRVALQNVQGLRGIAALIVVVAHISGPGEFEQRIFRSSWTSWLHMPANTGVDLFFVISGLIMVVTTWRTFDRPGSSRRFLLRRILRIYPLYWIVSSAIVFLYEESPSSVRWDGQRPNILESYLLLPHQGRLPLLVAWSLVFLMYFYLVFAVALLLGRSRLPWVMAGWVVVTLTLYATVGHTTNPYLAVVSSPLSLEFVLGAAIGLATVHGWLLRPYVVLALGIVSFSACLVFLGVSGWSQFPSDGVRVLVVAAPAGLIVYGAIGVETRYGHIVSPFHRRLGDASYSLYLTHLPALTLLATAWAGRLPSGPVVHALMLPAALAYVVIGAMACNAILERPLQNATARLLRRTG